MADEPTRDLRTDLTEALNLWLQGQQDPAIDQVRPHADSGSLPAVIMITWFMAQRSQADLAAPYVRTALDAGIVFPGLWHVGNYVGNAERAPLVLDIARALSDGGIAQDQVGNWQSLWNVGLQDAAVSLFEIAGMTQPRGLRSEWDRLVHDARDGTTEIQGAAAVVSKDRDDAIAAIGQFESAISDERDRVQRLVQETTDLVHRVTAGHIGTAYAERANSTLWAARLWTIAAILMGLAASAWAAYVAVQAFTEDEGLATTIGKTLVSIPLFVVAGYLANIAASNRRMAWHWSHIELQIRTAEPFIGNLDAETRNSLLAALAVRFFPGQGQDPQSASATSENLDIGTMLASILSKPPRTDRPSSSAAPAAPPPTSD